MKVMESRPGAAEREEENEKASGPEGEGMVVLEGPAAHVAAAVIIVTLTAFFENATFE